MNLCVGNSSWLYVDNIPRDRGLQSNPCYCSSISSTFTVLAQTVSNQAPNCHSWVISLSFLLRKMPHCCTLEWTLMTSLDNKGCLNAWMIMYEVLPHILVSSCELWTIAETQTDKNYKEQNVNIYLNKDLHFKSTHKNKSCKSDIPQQYRWPPHVWNEYIDTW